VPDKHPTSVPPSPRVNAERITREHAWSFRALASLSDAVVVTDVDGQVVYMNPASRKMFGLEPQHTPDVAYRDDYGIFFADEKTPIKESELPLNRALQGEVLRDVQLFVRNPNVPNGIHISVSAAPLRDEGGGFQGAVSITRDISPYRTAERLLRESEGQKKAILDNIPDIAWLKNVNSEFVLANPPLAASLGREPDAVIGLNDHDCFPKELADHYRKDDVRVMDTGETLRIEEPFVDAEGNRSVIETIKMRVVNEHGVVIGTTGIARDITDRKRAEEALRSMNDELERRVLERTNELAEAQESLVRRERLAVLGQLAGGVAHQIRNPLAAIMNASYVLQRHMGTNERDEVIHSISIIHDEVRRANEIITGLLDYARVRAPQRRPTHIQEVVERLLQGNWIPDTVLVLTRIESVPQIDVDPELLADGLRNLVQNAVDAMTFGGTLTLWVAREGDAVAIRVIDTGPGLSKEAKERLFEPLLTTKPNGIGLGLVTARTLVEAQGGRIVYVDSATGARFDVLLPISRGEGG